MIDLSFVTWDSVAQSLMTGVTAGITLGFTNYISNRWFVRHLERLEVAIARRMGKPA